MAREPFVIDKNEWQRMFDKFCNEVYAKKRKPIPYQLFRQIKNGPQKDAQVSFYDDGTVEIYDVARVGKPNFDMYSGEINDGSFGSYLSEYFQEEGKMHPDNKPVYDLWGLASESLTSVNKAEDNCCIAADGIGTAKVTTLAGDPYSNYADSCSTAVSTSYTTITDINSERIKELETAVTRLQEEVAQKANIDDVYHLENDLHQRVDELAWCADDHEAAINKLYDELEAMPKVSFQSTSSNCYPVKNYKIDIAGGCVCDNDRKENENMDTSKMFNFDFGPVASNIRMSPYGMAMKNADGKYVSYDRNSGNIVDVEIFNFDAQKFLYKMPVAVNAVAVGDIVVHMRKAMFVSAVNGNRISVVDIYNGEVKDIMPTTSPFGFNFITKVVSLIDMSGANAETPFGNMLPFLLMGDNKDNGNDKDNDNSMLLMAMAMSGGMNTNMMSNPLMLMAMMDGNTNTGMLMYLAMQNQIANMDANHNCNCGGNCGNHQ